MIDRQSSARASLLWIFLVPTKWKIVASVSQPLSTPDSTMLKRKMQYLNVGKHKIKPKGDASSTVDLANDYSWVETEKKYIGPDESSEDLPDLEYEGPQTYEISSPDDLNWWKVENEEIVKMFGDMSMSMPSTIPTAGHPTYMPTFLTCPNTLGFTTEIRNRNVNCELIKLLDEATRDLLCAREATFNDISQDIQKFCPDACNFDCNLQVPTPSPSKTCTDDLDFESHIRNKKITCDVVRYQTSDILELLCAREASFNGIEQKISKFCPDACDSDCSTNETPAPSQSCKDLDSFMVTIRKEKVTCDVVRFQTPEINELLCNRPVTFMEEDGPIKEFCPDACEYDCTKCEDDEKFQTKIANREIDCETVSSFQNDVKELLCSREAESQGKTQPIDQFCPSTCGKCDIECADDVRFITPLAGKDVTCAYVSSQTNEDLVDLLCSRTVSSSGKTQTIATFCPITCGTDCTPKMMPTLIPSNTPTNLPTSMPTNAPTSPPTDSPTISPTFTPTTSSPTLTPTRCPQRTDEERREALVNRYAESPSDISGDAQIKALDFVITLNPDPCGEDPYDLQRYVAAVLYYSTGGDNWNEKGNYLSSVDECNWRGIGCNDDELITSIVQNENNLIGTLPEELQHLEKLLNIELDDNSISGTFPEVYTNLEFVFNINIDSNGLTGSLPSTMGNLQNLRYLDIDNNSFTGSLPSSLFTVIGLEVLDINDNDISGALLPEFGDLVDLRILQMQNNLFDGTVPVEMASLTKLQEFYFHGNDFTGVVPEEVCALDIPDFIAPCDICGSESCCEGCRNNEGRSGELPDFDPFVGWLEGWLQLTP